MTAQEQIRKMLEKEFAFEFVSKKSTNFGERWLMRCTQANLEAQLGVHRICFYTSALRTDAAETSNIQVQDDSLSAVRPLCFDTDGRSDVRAFLQKTLKVTKISSKISAQKTLFAGV